MFKTKRSIVISDRSKTPHDVEIEMSENIRALCEKAVKGGVK
jgi:hypothetical protein